MKKLALLCGLLFQSGLCFSQDSINLILLPTPYCSQLGVETKISENSTLGVIGRSDCKSSRPTYGKENSNVNNTFSRILIPWRYSKGGAFKNGFFMQGLMGIEQSEFKSKLGSTANVTFVDIAFHVGYQWFWSNGLNVSVLGGGALLVENDSDKNIMLNESVDVVGFLDKNTKTNTHLAGGVLVGWLF